MTYEERARKALANGKEKQERHCVYTAKIRAVTLGSNFTAQTSCQVPFCRCKISGLELVFSVIDPDFKAVDQLIGVKPYLSNLYYNPWHGVVCRNIQL